MEDEDGVSCCVLRVASPPSPCPLVSCLLLFVVGRWSLVVRRDDVGHQPLLAGTSSRASTTASRTAGARQHGLDSPSSIRKPRILT